MVTEGRLRIFWKCCFCLPLVFLGVHSRVHTLNLKNDYREMIQASTFGFMKNGYLEVNMTNFSFRLKTTDDINLDKAFGFTIDRSGSSSLSSYLESNREKCVLRENAEKLIEEKNVDLVLLKFDIAGEKLSISRYGKNIKTLLILDKTYNEYVRDVIHNKQTLVRNARDVAPPGGNETSKNTTATIEGSGPKAGSASDKDKTGKESSPTETAKSEKNVTETQGSGKEDSSADVEKILTELPLTVVRDEEGNVINLRTHFLVVVRDDAEEGLYNLFFHNCLNTPLESTTVNITINIVEKNEDSFLSAGGYALPPMYFAFCLLYLCTGIHWYFVLKKSRESVYKIHYLMLLIVTLKMMSFLFHGINNYFIGRHGYQEEAWAVLYYITHLLKGVLLFTIIALIGAGWAFVKYMLSDKDKKIVVAAIILQIISNVGQIIVDETEEGQYSHSYWKMIFITVDLLCCGAVLFPIVWSIRHLHDASQTDGKAAINLQKLKLFRQFYILVVCYIYATRIIVELLKITVPFQWSWLVELFREISTYAFFVVTGYKFRPADDNPYLQVPTEEEDLEMEEVITKTGMHEGLTKVNIKYEEPSPEAIPTTTTLPKQRESSHEYD